MDEGSGALDQWKLLASGSSHIVGNVLGAYSLLGGEVELQLPLSLSCTRVKTFNPLIGRQRRRFGSVGRCGQRRAWCAPDGGLFLSSWWRIAVEGRLSPQAAVFSTVWSCLSGGLTPSSMGERGLGSPLWRVRWDNLMRVGGLGEFLPLPVDALLISFVMSSWGPLQRWRRLALHLFFANSEHSKARSFPTA